MSKKTIFVSGGSGFIGRNFIEQTREDYDLLSPSHLELDLMDGEAVRSYFSKNPVDAVLHCANIGGNRKATADNSVEKNLRMFYNLADCHPHWGRFIQCGSGAEYDKAHSRPKMNEGYFGSHIPADEYGFYKYVCARHIESSPHDMVGLRIFGLYGKYEDYEIKFISNNLAKAVHRLPLSIANQNVFFDYLYIDDLVQIVRRFIEKRPQERFYNATPDNSIDLLSLAQKINALAGGTLEIRVNKPGLGREYSGDNALLKKELGGFEFTPIDEGISRLYRYYRENKEKLDLDRISVDRY